MSVSQDSPPSHKRNHDSFSLEDLPQLEKPLTLDSQFNISFGLKESQEDPTLSTRAPAVHDFEQNANSSNSRRSSTTSLTDAASATPSRGSTPGLIDSAFLQPAALTSTPVLSGLAPPNAKRVKLTSAEKEARRIEKETKDKARAEQKAVKEAERARKEVERAKKEEKKRRREEEKLRAEDEKKKKERNQKTLSSFFSIPPATKRTSAGDASTTPAQGLSVAAGLPAPICDKSELSVYDKLFPAFFVQNNVTMAPINRFERDSDATNALEKSIDRYLCSDQERANLRGFDPISLFHLSGTENGSRGKQYMPVREIMAEAAGSAQKPIDLSTDLQNTQIKRTGDLLKKVPLKFLKFQEDVRPPYRGTYTTRPISGAAKLARNPLRRDLPTTDYDYDSEAEWVEGDEEAEDLDSDGEEEDAEMGEDGEDMDGFLDDEGDESAIPRRLVLQGDLEPVSSGLCWENQHKKSSNVKMMPYRMEILLDGRPKQIDPLSTSYWEQPAPKKTDMPPPRLPLNAVISNSRTGPFDHLNSAIAKTAASSSKGSKPKQQIPSDGLETFKNAVRGSDQTKVGLIEILKKKFTGRFTAAQIKGTLETIAARVGLKESEKRWVIVAEQEV